MIIFGVGDEGEEVKERMLEGNGVMVAPSRNK
jgi:hypothetical protein